MFSLFLQYLYDFLDALITQQTSPEEAFRKFDEMGSRHTESLRRLTKQVQEARHNHDEDAVKRAVNEYEETLDRSANLDDGQAGQTPAQKRASFESYTTRNGKKFNY